MGRLVFGRTDDGGSSDNDPKEQCQHSEVHEIGCDFDKDGMFLRLVRCHKCGLLMRQYLPMLRR